MYNRKVCFNTQPPEGGWKINHKLPRGRNVSTHSRLKAAGIVYGRCVVFSTCFNTQPPEGGWVLQAAISGISGKVSTHSRLKAAGFGAVPQKIRKSVSTHSRLKAAGLTHNSCRSRYWVSTHSRLKAAGEVRITLLSPF